MSFGFAFRVSRAPIAALATVGVFWGSFAAFVPDIKAQAGASDAELGLALIMSAVGGIAAMSLAPRFIARLGKWALPLAALAVVVAFAYPLAASSVPLLGAALLGMGASVALLDISANVRISVLEERHRLHLMNLNHAMFSFAFAGAAFAVSLARRQGLAPVEVLPLLALVCLVLAAAMIEGRGWQDAVAAPEGAGDAGVWAAILPVAAILFFAFVCENATDSWSALHIERTLGGPSGEGGFGPAVFGLTMGVGRLSGQVAARRLGEAGLIFWSALVGVVGALVLAVAPTALVAIIGVGLLGLGVAVTVPSANSILGRLVRPDQRGFAISRAWMIGFTGFFVGPTLIGQISEYAGLRVAFLAVAVLMALIVPAVLALGRRHAPA